MRIDPYIGDLMGATSLMIGESRVVASLLLKNLTEEEWNDALVNQNVLQKGSPQTAKRRARCLKYRLDPLPRSFLELIDAGADKEVKQLLFAALLNHSPLVVDFFKFAVIEPKLTFKQQMHSHVWLEFIDQKIRYQAGLLKLTDSTLVKMRRSIISSFVEAGYLEDSKTLNYQNVYVLPATQDLLSSLNRHDLIAVMECRN